MIRLFVAVALPERLKPWVEGLQSGVPGAKWATSDNLHLTLRFIGNVDGRLFADIMDALGAIRAPAFDLQLAGLGKFGERGRAESLWVGADRCEPLDRLQGKVETTLQRLGLEPEHRKFLPHLTVARLKGAPAGRVADWLTAHAGFALPPFRVDRFILFSSYLAREGAIHRAEAEYPLMEGA
jgi:2'-5' RNA ligase